MGMYRIGQAAELLGVSADTVRRWIDSGRLLAERTARGQRMIESAELARFVAEISESERPQGLRAQSVRNHMTGIVIQVTKDGVAAQVEIQAGPFRLVSLITRDAADELNLEPGVLAVASVKSTNLTVQLPPTSSSKTPSNPRGTASR